MMKSVLATLALIGATFAQLTIDTPPSLTECVPAAITWHEGTPPYFPAVIPAGETAAAPILQFAETSVTSLTWIVNITSGTNVTFKITDSTGVSAFSGADVIQPGTSTSCVGAVTGNSSTTSGSASSTTTTTSATPSSTTTTTTGAVTTTTTTATSSATTTTHSSGTGSSTTTSPSTSPSAVGGSTSGASMMTAPLAVVLGLFALLA